MSHLWTFLESGPGCKHMTVIRRDYSSLLIKALAHSSYWTIVLSTPRLLVRENVGYLQIFIRNDLFK